ncbi:MAG: hypothetical protein ABIF19_21050 [Planctomycetota bacterium]
MNRQTCLMSAVLTLVFLGTALGQLEAADIARGGALYDQWWAVTGAAAPTGDHPLWALRPDTTSNTRTGLDTWRCKECHGWDYKGVAGVYGSGSHRTGISGIFGTAKTAQEVFDLIKTDHAYGTAGLSDEDIWDLAAFVTEGQIDTDSIIDTDGAFIGDTGTGQTLYDSGIGTNIACATCHGPLGLTPPPGHPDFDEYVGLLSNDNPWEFQHKVQFGQPGTPMPSSVTGGGTTLDVADLGAYAQTLPQAAPGVVKIDMTPPGHWHVTRAKMLSFTVTDDGNPVAGLSPTVAVKTFAGTADTLMVTDNGDGTYSAEHIARDIGSGYAMAYSILFSVEYNGVSYFDAWPAEVVRDGRENILPTINDTLYAYQVRYGWVPGTVHASDTELVSMYFEPRRAIQEGGDINTQQPFRNTFNHLTDLVPMVLVESADGRVSEVLNATYTGLGVYRAQRIFSMAEVGAWTDYTVSILFTDPYNGFTLDASETAYPIVVSAPKQDTSFDPETPESLLLEGKLIFESACAGCHSLPTADDMKAFPTDDALVVLVTGMAEGAGLSDEDAEKVVLYSLALRHDVAVGMQAVIDFYEPRSLATLAGFLVLGVFLPARKWLRG